ncbi:N-acetylglucosamine-binding protein GbpA [Pleionea litopenaei]|uniref:N-acetylglucosamine-binding protein GbpA n=1 Tax=Pleionea litopenaei TaxID=3070815 RepID=A0AA51RQY6_9GAMM|nr:N-acetylglucosamine-binding protein GbpA [Pleionea sp. HL-JVS1]WMS85922.1 N-acetylglucosamine-binding protein GbpA [Pleionea sp. HL-JVS1]
MKKITTLLSGCSLLLLGTSALDLYSHGYVKSPESRSYLCHLRTNTNCGAIQWEPQSVEGLDRFPGSGPADGTIAAAGLPQFSELNQQTSTRWVKRSAQSGNFSFTWRFTANHASRDFRYFITRSGWDQNQPLTRASFDLTPFCSVSGNNQRPPAELTHNCVLPSRSGYHVVLAVWDVADTVNSFYQAIDLAFGGVEPPRWQDIGDINPTMDLNPGDKVRTRVFDSNGERTEFRTEIAISSAADGARNTWPKNLADAINREQNELRAGILDSQGNIVPTEGKNDVFTGNDSSLVRVEIEIEQTQVDPEYRVDALQSAYSIVDGVANVNFTLISNSPFDIQANLLDAQQRIIATQQQSVDGEMAFNLTVTNAVAGNYQLQIIAQDSQGSTSEQNFDLSLTSSPNGGYDYVYPDGLSNYDAGTQVLAKDGKIYQCKPFPYSGWCSIYSPSNNAYEPGAGAYWQDAWDLLSQ